MSSLALALTLVGSVGVLGSVTWPYLSYLTQDTIKDGWGFTWRGLLAGVGILVGFLLAKGLFDWVGSRQRGEFGMKSELSWLNFLGAVIGTELIILAVAAGLGLLYGTLPADQRRKGVDEESFTLFTAFLSNWVFIPMAVSKGVLKYTESRESARKWAMFTMGIIPLVGLPLLMVLD